MTHLLATLGNSTRDMSRLLYGYRDVLRAITWVELAKRYSGSTFGKLWVVLHPTLLLSIYLFVYLVIFKMRFPGYSRLDYVMYVFCGLVPYIGLSEALSSGAASIKQNIHLVKNLMLPIELLPVRAVAVSLVSELVSLGVLVGLAALNGSLGVQVVWLPAVLAAQVLWLVGLAWILSALAVTLPDVGYFVNLGLLLLLFISPIGFKPDMVPGSLLWMVYGNPIYYLTEMFRASLLYDRPPSAAVLAVYATMTLGTFVLGAAFFRKFKLVLIDYE